MTVTTESGGRQNVSQMKLAHILMSQFHTMVILRMLRKSMVVGA